jgi:ornithine carbamoyltransferase
MLQLTTKHLITGEELSATEILALITLAKELKQHRKHGKMTPYLSGKHLALVFSKPSLRTRFSFTVAMRELGGDVAETISDTRKNEDPEDQARVLGGYCHGIMIRTHADENLSRMQAVTSVPIINGLSDLHHPCQILSDLLTIQENLGRLQDVQLTYIGDGNNILHSLLLIAPILGVRVHYSCPKTRQPNIEILQRAKRRAASNNMIQNFSQAADAAKNADIVYTDVWTSMGFEQQANNELFTGFQVNEDLMKHASKDALFMHCLPMERGKEVSKTLPDQPYSVIFQQSENRLHLQKALLVGLLGM